MPIVNGKHYPYTEKGKKAAKRKMRTSDGYMMMDKSEMKKKMK